MKSKIGMVAIGGLILLGLGTLYVKDSATARQAIAVQAYLENYCRSHNRYPEIGQLTNQFPELYPNRQWYYWPNETRTAPPFSTP